MYLVSKTMLSTGYCASIIEKNQNNMWTCIGTQEILVIVYGVWRTYTCRTTETEYANKRSIKIHFSVNEPMRCLVKINTIVLMG